MRTRKALINSFINIFTYILLFIPNLIMRKVFLDTLGSEILGLSSLYNNILGWLSIIELGIGSAIVFSMYKPYADNDKKMMNAYIRFYGKFYRGIGIIILIIGICITPFLKNLIENNLNIKLVTIGFLLFLLNSFVSYMFSHKMCILNVAQEAYKVTIGTTISQLIILLLQVLILKVYPDFILFASIQLMINFMYYLIINIYINMKYPWLCTEKNELEHSEKVNLFKNIKALFMHKIGTLIVNSTDNLVISKFIGLAELSNYTNYYTVISAAQKLISNGLNGITASIGSMLTLGNKEKAYTIHKNLFFLNFWVVSFISISLYNTLNQFIALWIGTEYLLDNITYIVILANLYFALMRGSVEQFQNGSGNFYQDRYAPLLESFINLGFSIYLVKRIGLAGVFIGTLISNITVIFWTKPYVVYKYVFNKPLYGYFKMYFKYLSIALVVLFITNCLTSPFKNSISIMSFIINCTINIITINLIYLIIFYNSDEFKYYYYMSKNIFDKNRNIKENTLKQINTAD